MGGVAVGFLEHGLHYLDEFQAEYLWGLLGLSLAGMAWRFPMAVAVVMLPGMAILPCALEWAAVLPCASLALKWWWDHRKGGAARPRSEKMALALLCFWLGWGILSAVLSTDQAWALWSALRLAGLALGGWAAGSMLAGKRISAWTPWAAIGLSLVVVVGILRFPHFGKASSTPFFPDTNILSAAIVLVLPLLLRFIIDQKNNWRGWLTATMVLVLLAGIVIFRSRGAWLSLIAMTMALPMLYLRQPRLRMGYAAALLIAAATYFGVRAMQPAAEPTTTDPLGQLRSIGEIGQDFSNRERIMRWECALRMAKVHPLFGFGPGRYPDKFRLYIRGWEEGDRISYWFGWKLGAHNDTLTALAETGWPGALALGTLLAMTAWRGMIRPKEEGTADGLQAAVALGLLGWVVHGCFNDLLANACLALWGFTLIAWRHAANTPTNPGKSEG